MQSLRQSIVRLPIQRTFTLNTRISGLSRYYSTEPASLPDHSQVVICGGGVIGCSVAYHLAKIGWNDVVLLEQGRYEEIFAQYSCSCSIY